MQVVGKRYGWSGWGLGDTAKGGTFNGGCEGEEETVDSKWGAHGGV